VPDSICYPEVSDSRYPYTPDGDRHFLEDSPSWKPFSLIQRWRPVTTRLRFTTFVVSCRSSSHAGREVRELGRVLSDNRFAFGVGTSPWRKIFRPAAQE